MTYTGFFPTSDFPAPCSPFPAPFAILIRVLLTRYNNDRPKFCS
ncbi:hypothetical protein [Moorena sp. SIO1F2]|nr:hypothetical protein [Moorena sp. SIO1F2]